MYTKITKPAARKLYNEGRPFIIVSCKMRPEYGIGFNPAWRANYRDFDNMVERFAEYNCRNNETGRYPAFWIKED